MSSIADRVIPNTLHYTSIKPQVIENDIKLVRYQPQQSSTGVQGGETIKLIINGSGFYDPYSAFLKFTVVCDDLAPGEVRFLDRSAHSFISKILVRSNGVELERIEDYDIIAAMINDMIYSPEQNALHAWEGFATHEMQLDDLQQSSVAGHIANVTGSHYMVTPRDALSALNMFGTSAAAPLIGAALAYAEGDRMPFSGLAYGGISSRGKIQQMLGEGAAPTLKKCIGEVAFGDPLVVQNTMTSPLQMYSGSGILPPQVLQSGYYDLEHIPNNSVLGSQGARTAGINAVGGLMNGQRVVDSPFLTDLHFAAKYPLTRSELPDRGTGDQSTYRPVNYVGHINGRKIPTITDASATTITLPRFNTKTFIIPLYSGILGVLMPDKKLLPLSLLPLDIEITMNRHALYSSGVEGVDESIANNNNSAYQGSRNYRVVDFNLFSNVTFFENEISKSLEASVVEHGLFIYANSFHQVPRAVINTSVPSNVLMGANLKSINSVHWIFLYSQYQGNSLIRKLHFVSHNLQTAILRNGVTMIPQYKIEGNSGTSCTGKSNALNYVPFLVETLKAWNKLHDPTTDGLIQAFNYCSDDYDFQYDHTWVGPSAMKNATLCNEALLRLVTKQAMVGRCQYAISMEGEDLGEEKTMITGRKSEQPFQIEFQPSQGGLMHGTDESHIMPYLRADFIVYIRPDMQVVTLGK